MRGMWFFFGAGTLAGQKVAIVVEINAVGTFRAAEAADSGSGVGVAYGGHGGMEFAPALLADVVPPLAHGG